MPINDMIAIHLLTWLIYSVKPSNYDLLLMYNKRVGKALVIAQKKYISALVVYSITALTNIFGIILYCVIDAPVNRKCLVNGIIATEKYYLRGTMGIVGNLRTKDT